MEKNIRTEEKWSDKNESYNILLLYVKINLLNTNKLDIYLKVKILNGVYL